MIHAYIRNKILAKQQVQLGALLKHYLFVIGEVLAVGQIVDAKATSFEILNDDGTFSVDNSGNITFNELPDYNAQRLYTVRIKSNRGYYYKVTVYVTIFLEGYLWTGTEYIYNDTYFAA